ncbi:hypothetical protein HID58_093892, partial [Brassica napus]
HWKHVQAIPIHCPRRKVKAFNLYLVWRLKNEERRCLRHGGFKRKSGMVRSIKWNKKMLWRQEDSNKSWRQSVGYGIGCSGLRTGCKEL